MRATSDLLIFNEVIASGSFANAAKHLNMTPSGVSRRISKLEERLGVRLIHRTTRSLALTEAGEALLEHSIGILAAIEDAETMVKNMSASPSGLLRVSASDAFAIEVLVPFLRTFLDKYRGISVTLLQGDGPIDLVEQRIDVAIRFEQPDAESYISRRLLADPWFVCASPEYLQRNGTPTRPNDLAAHNCLTIHAHGRLTDHWEFEHPEHGPETVIAKGSFAGIGLAVKEAILQGHGIGRLAHFLVCSEIKKGRLMPLLVDYAPLSERSIYVVYPNRRHLPLKSRLFIDELAAHMKRVLAIPSRI